MEEVFSLNRIDIRSKLLVSAVLSLALLVFGVTALAQTETQTPSEKIGSGALKVIEGELSGSGVQSESEKLSEAEKLIEDGVPPGIVVSVVKSLKTGHLSPDELEGVFKDLRTNVVENDMPPGLVIKSIKTTYQLPEDVGEPEKAQKQEENGKPDKAGPPEDKGNNGDKGPPEDKGKSNDKGPPEDNGNNNGNGNDKDKSQSKGKKGPPEDRGNSGKGGPPEDEEK